jgi:hypothetical protein
LLVFDAEDAAPGSSHRPLVPLMAWAHYSACLTLNGGTYYLCFIWSS